MELEGLPIPEGMEQAAEKTFWGHIGARLVTYSADRVVATLEMKPHHLNLMGILHGGVTASLVDSAMGVAVMAARPDQAAVTTNLNIHYLASVKGGTIRVVARTIHATRKMITADASVYNDQDELCAYGTGTFRISSSGSVN